MKAALLEPLEVESLDWRRSRPQAWRDAWRGNRLRVCRYVGRCVLCGTRTYAFDDGENDPRGVLGGHAADVLVAADFEMVGPDVVACFLCLNNDERRYDWAIRLAKREWTEAS